MGVATSQKSPLPASLFAGPNELELLNDRLGNVRLPRAVDSILNHFDDAERSDQEEFSKADVSMGCVTCLILPNGTFRETCRGGDLAVPSRLHGPQGLPEPGKHSHSTWSNLPFGCSAVAADGTGSLMCMYTFFGVIADIAFS